MLRGMFNRVRELTGIYGLGFERESMLGVILPVAFVILIGGLGALLIAVL